MAKEAHTPGPWSYGSATNYEGFYIAPAGRLPTLCAVIDNGRVAVFNFPGETEPNARLIAAAPDGYDANVAALGLLEEIAEADGLTPELDEVITGLRAAIAKARGEAQ